MARQLKIFQKIKYKLSTIKKSTVIWLIVGGVVIVAIGVLMYFYWGEITLAIPGLVDHDDYNEITIDKNDLISSNSELISQNDSYEVQLSELETDKYSQKSEIYTSITENLSLIITNIGKMISLNEQMSGMSLPSYIQRYVELSDELDKLRLQAIQKSLFVAEARADLNDLNKDRSAFDSCLNAVDWDGTDSEINTEILACIDLLDVVDTSVETLEGDYDVDLTDLKNYFTLLEEQWTASANYYLYLSKKNYTEANEYDSVFADKRSEVEELDLDETLGEFTTAVILPALDEFTEINDNVEIKQEEVDSWYEENIEK